MVATTKKPKVKIVTFSDDAIKGYASLTEKINSAYAGAHGYEFKAYHDRVLGDDWDVHWEKVRILRDELGDRNNDYVVWIDADAAFNLHDMSLESFMSGKDIVISHDGVNKKDKLSEVDRDQPWFVNTGVLLVKNTPWSRKFVHRWIETAGQYKKGSPLQDQDKFVEMLRDNKKVLKHLTVLPPKALNSEYGEDTQNTFVWHMMKKENAEREKKFNELLTRITNDAPTVEDDKAVVENAYFSRYRSHPGKTSPVLIVMLYDDAILDYSSVAENINRKYAANHGYDLVSVRSRLSDRDPQWDKVRAMSILMNDVPEAKDHEWFFWIDSDAAFAKHGVVLKDILDSSGKDMVISNDNPNKGRVPGEGEVFVNTGTFGFKNSDWAKAFVKEWWETPMGKEKVLYHEQDVFNHLYKSNTRGVKDNVSVEPYSVMNSAFGELPKSDFGPVQKTFVLHMMKRPAQLRRAVFDKLERKVGTGRRPAHVVDPPDRFFKTKPLSEAYDTDKWVATAVFIAIIVALVALFVYKKLRTTRARSQIQ